MTTANATIACADIIPAHKYVMLTSKEVQLNLTVPIDFAKYVAGYRGKRKIEWFLGNRKVNSEVEYVK
jgi:hypothetical protein